MLGAPWNTRVHFLTGRKEETQSTMYEGMFLERRRDRSLAAFTLSKPAFLVQEEGGDLQQWPLEGSNLVRKGSHCVRGAEASQSGWDGAGRPAWQEM